MLLESNLLEATAAFFFGCDCRLDVVAAFFVVAAGGLLAVKISLSSADTTTLSESDWDTAAVLVGGGIVLVAFFPAAEADLPLAVSAFRFLVATSSFLADLRLLLLDAVFLAGFFFFFFAEPALAEESASEEGFLDLVAADRLGFSLLSSGPKFITSLLDRDRPPRFNSSCFWTYCSSTSFSVPPRMYRTSTATTMPGPSV